MLIKNLWEQRSMGPGDLLTSFRTKTGADGGWKIFCEDYEQPAPLNAYTHATVRDVKNVLFLHSSVLYTNMVK